MKLYHTSPVEINAIVAFGRFGDFLFFSNNEYVTVAGEHITYSLEIDEHDLIDAEQLFYHEAAEKLSGLVETVMNLVGCDERTAEELIAQNKDVHFIGSSMHPDDLADASWDIQRISGEAAVLLGYRGVAMDDEQGRTYLVCMNGRQSELEISRETARS